ncbi:ComF family protein [Novosphingobium cyanobacteriorum]|uniref:ComF family protein n=1 Tax=Novosphingobium cyanobacteriorum TaxID=3024215 RepID=A0ABT6CNC9_9SPHN|nr:ComF family protein [Novosphingobium cyanobacteriorum]MDF8335421.1 ComF family protein [Novosphingobium cyanobacteriorum]
MDASSLLSPLVDLVFPPRCPLCGDPLARQGGLCVTCWSRLAIPGDPCCARCQRPLPDRHDGEDTAALVCAPCMMDPPRHEGIAAATLYNEASRDLVLAFKHGRRIALAELLARLMLARIPALEGEWLVVPVPLHRWRMWRRGFNQSALLARRIAEALGQPVLVDGLVRVRQTPSLGRLNRRQRAQALDGAIAAHAGRKDRLEGANVLLVDDVMTSGATTNACIKALRKAGVGGIRITCFARVLDEALELAGEGQSLAA